MPNAVQRVLPKAGDLEPLLREIVSSLAVLSTRLEDVVHKLDGTHHDAQEGLKLSNRLSTILEEQNVIGKLDEYRIDTKMGIADLRTDIVAANTLLRQDALSLGDRIKSLEDDRNRRDGAVGLLGWLSKNAPWLFAALIAIIAWLGLKPGSP